MPNKKAAAIDVDVRFEIGNLPGLVKCQALWLHVGVKGFPLVYFRKPKWLSEKKFKAVLAGLSLSLPPNFLEPEDE